MRKDFFQAFEQYFYRPEDPNLVRVKIGKTHIKNFKYYLSFKRKGTQEVYESILKDFLLYLRNYGLVLTKERIIKYLKKISPNSRHLYFYAIKFFLEKNMIPIFIAWDEIKPQSHTEINRPRFSNEEIKAIIEVTKKYGGILENAYIFLFTIYGCRRSEAFDLSEKDIFEENGEHYIRILTKKGGRIRNHLIPEKFVYLFEDFKKILPKIEQAKRKKILTEERINLMFNSLMDAAGIEKRRRLNIHAIRRTLVSELRLKAQTVGRGELNDLVIFDFLRWRQGTIMETYTVLASRDIDLLIFKYHPFLGFWKKI